MSQTTAVPTGNPSLKALRESLGMSQEDLAERTGYHRKTIHRWETGQGKPRKAVVDFLRLAASGRPPRTDGPTQFTFIDLFAGIGGTRMGFESAGGKCVFTSEWDKYAQITYRENFGDSHPIAGDITQIEADVIPKHDVLLGGFPCQPFSIAGVSKKNSLGRAHGFADETQGTLFFDIARILRHHAPRAFMLENVKNLRSHDRGRTFEVICRTLQEDLGYHLYTGVIDAASFVPQHRERIFLIGFREKVDFEWDDIHLPDRREGPTLKSILHREDGGEAAEERFLDASGGVLDKYVLSDKLWQYLQDYAEKHRKKGNGFGFGLVEEDNIARTLSARYYKDGSEILVARDQGNPRRLTPRECARLMGFDGPGRPRFKIPVSDTQAYKQFGNSVVVPVIRAIASAMAPHLVAEASVDADQLGLPLS